MDILLVEDSSADAYLFREVMARGKSAPFIHWVVDGTHALDYVFRRKKYQYADKPDVIVLDLNLPRVTGFDVLRELKDDPEASNIPVVVLTTSRAPLDHSQSKTLGADMCLTKPHAVKDYKEMVDRLMDWANIRVIKDRAAI